jgi:hypothetical protein
MRKVLLYLIFLFSEMLFCKSFGMAGYETFPHMDGQQIQQVENQAIVNYNYGLISLHHLNHNHQDCSACFKLHLQNGDWITTEIQEIPQNFTLMQAIQMARTRVNLIPVADNLLNAITILFNEVGNDENKQQILQNALNTALNNIQSFRPGIRGNYSAFVNKIKALSIQLVNGGYGTYTTAVLYHIKFNNIINDFIDVDPELLDQVQHIIFHIKLHQRVSKNIRELSINSLNLNVPLDQGEVAFYESLKHKLNEGFNKPSATVMSYSDYQEVNNFDNQ